MPNSRARAREWLKASLVRARSADVARPMGDTCPMSPVLFKSFLLELIAFRLIPAICPARRAKPENDWKR